LQPKPKQQAPPPPPPPAETPKWSVENHPAYQGTGRKPPTQQQQAEEPVQAHTYHVNEKVQARYRGKFYNARIISMFGSSKDPKFTIKFDDYPETPTMGVEGLRPLVAPAPPQQTKRKAEDEPPAPQSTHTFSAAANINEELAQARKEPSKVGDGPPKSAKVAKKLKNNKTYEKSANDWKAFNSKMSGKGKMGKKESMFRTGEGVNARGMTSCCCTMPLG
jgi:survival-of-motor-neuron-related-splicing factor 30